MSSDISTMRLAPEQARHLKSAISEWCGMPSAWSSVARAEAGSLSDEQRRIERKLRASTDKDEEGPGPTIWDQMVARSEGIVLHPDRLSSAEQWVSTPVFERREIHRAERALFRLAREEPRQAACLIRFYGPVPPGTWFVHESLEELGRVASLTPTAGGDVGLKHALRHRKASVLRWDGEPSDAFRRRLDQAQKQLDDIRKKALSAIIEEAKMLFGDSCGRYRILLGKVDVSWVK